MLKRASASRPSGEWNDDDYNVLADRTIVGRILKANASPVSSPVDVDARIRLSRGPHADARRRARRRSRRVGDASKGGASMKPETWVAFYAAIIGTSAFLLNLKTWFDSGVKLKLVPDGMTIGGGPNVDAEHLIIFYVTNSRRLRDHDKEHGSIRN
jgi:hypothetical protein